MAAKYVGLVGAAFLTKLTAGIDDVLYLVPFLTGDLPRKVIIKNAITYVACICSVVGISTGLATLGDRVLEKTVSESSYWNSKRVISLCSGILLIMYTLHLFFLWRKDKEAANSAAEVVYIVTHGDPSLYATPRHPRKNRRDDPNVMPDMSPVKRPPTNIITIPEIAPVTPEKKHSDSPGITVMPTPCTPDTSISLDASTPGGVPVQREFEVNISINSDTKTPQSSLRDEKVPLLDEKHGSPQSLISGKGVGSPLETSPSRTPRTPPRSDHRLATATRPPESKVVHTGARLQANLVVVTYIGSLVDVTIFAPLLLAGVFTPDQLALGVFLAACCVLMLVFGAGFIKPLTDLIHKVPLWVVTGCLGLSSIIVNQVPYFDHN